MKVRENYQSGLVAGVVLAVGVDDGRVDEIELAQVEEVGGLGGQVALHLVDESGRWLTDAGESGQDGKFGDVSLALVGVLVDECEDGVEGRLGIHEQKRFGERKSRVNVTNTS